LIASEPAGSERERAIRVAVGVFAGFALLAAVNAVAIALLVPLPAAGVPLRLADHVFDAAETLGVGAVASLAVGAFVRFVRLPSWAMECLMMAVTIAVVRVAIGEALLRAASLLLEGRFESVLFVGSLVLIGVAFPPILQLAARLSRHPRLRFIPIAVAIVAIVIDQKCVPDDYSGMHCVVACGAALVGGIGLAPLAERAGYALAESRRGRAAIAGAALFALFGLVWPPSNATRYELFRQPCAIAQWVLATTVWRSPRLHAPVALPPSPWVESRSSAPPVPPTTPPVLPADAVVVLITIDALRAEAVSNPANDARYPTFAALKREGVVFTHASAAATQTPLSLGTLFSGLYFSEQLWSDHGVGSTRYLYPIDDSFPRFPKLLADHGVMTANYAGLIFLGHGFGVAEGFREERVVVEGRRHAQAHELIDPLLDRLAHWGRGPLFLYTHLMEPHRPYDRGRTDGTDYERYLSEVAIADAAVGKVVRLLAQRFGNRWALFVSADHGEAFGEHQSSEHGKTLYEELLHVPLLARSPLFQRRAIDERVGLVDLGPTILDLFGVQTPATFNGQSLVPLLAGGTTSFTRPLLAEGRLRQSLTEPDGLKVIDDPLRKVVEVYDLIADPGETRNLFDVDPARSDHALAELRAFFAVHTRRDGGYEAPYKP
jgi:arylsulfatase A-like enzyme